MKKLLPLILLPFLFFSCEDGLVEGQEIPTLIDNDDDGDGDDGTVTVVGREF